MDQLHIAEYLPDDAVREYVLCLLAHTLFHTSAGRTKMGIFLAGGVNAGKPSRLLTKYSLLPTHTVHPIHYSLQLTAYSLLHAVYLLLTQCTGKTSLSKLIQSSAGEYAGSGESASLNQKKGAVAAAQTRLSNASGGRQFALLDELPAREQFCWLKYKNFTTGFSTQRAVNPNATTLIKEETPMLLIACNLGQLPLKPDESQGVLEKVCILFSEHLGNFGASEAGAEIAHNIQEGSIRWADVANPLADAACLRRSHRSSVRLRQRHAGRAEGGEDDAVGRADGRGHQ